MPPKAPIPEVESLLMICLDFVAKNIGTFPTESLESLEKEPSDSEKDDVNVPFSLTDLRNLANFLIKYLPLYYLT